MTSTTTDSSFWIIEKQNKGLEEEELKPSYVQEVQATSDLGGACCAGQLNPSSGQCSSCSHHMEGTMIDI